MIENTCLTLVDSLVLWLGIFYFQIPLVGVLRLDNRKTLISSVEEIIRCQNMQITFSHPWNLEEGRKENGKNVNRAKKDQEVSRLEEKLKGFSKFSLAEIHHMSHSRDDDDVFESFFWAGKSKFAWDRRSETSEGGMKCGFLIVWLLAKAKHLSIIHREKTTTRERKSKENFMFFFSPLPC